MDLKSTEKKKKKALRKLQHRHAFKLPKTKSESLWEVVDPYDEANNFRLKRVTNRCLQKLRLQEEHNTTLDIPRSDPAHRLIENLQLKRIYNGSQEGSSSQSSISPAKKKSFLRLPEIVGYKQYKALYS